MNEKEWLERERWFSLLYYTEHQGVNVERVDVVEQLSGRETLEYVLRTLDLLEEDLQDGKLNEEEEAVVRKVLQWSEVAKGGNEQQRDGWRSKGYALDIHNLASAEIYREEDPDDFSPVVYTLIRTHGLIGQALRGEVSVAKNRELLTLLPGTGAADNERGKETGNEIGNETVKECAETGEQVITSASLGRIVHVLNHCIIGGVSRKLWDQVGPQADKLIDRILSGDFTEFSTRERMSRLDPRLADADPELQRLFGEILFPRYELWYFQAAFQDFSLRQIEWLLSRVAEKAEEGISYISFKPVADGLYYDYEGRKHLNVYKERIIEKYIRDEQTTNVELVVKSLGRALNVDFCFSKVCAKLIDFCVEAERSGLLSFEKSITVLYDMFGFRRDEFDRLNNEEKYLATMNDSEDSTKNTITEYAVGQRIVDVGSGGGVLLDLLEEQYPEKEIIGTDISENVIEALTRKQKNEGHRWTVRRHNFEQESFGEPVDTVIFSSILHEIFSYTETENGRFELETVYRALKNAYASLRPGGRIVIRDGVKTPEEDILQVTFHEASGLVFFRNYVRDFQGLKDIPDRKIRIDEKTLTVSAVTNFMREFLYTYTWGQESYAHEVQEQFGYLTIQEYRDFFESLGARLIRCDEFLEPGYVQHLSPKVTLSPDVYPCSNCIVVAEKP